MVVIYRGLGWLVLLLWSALVGLGAYVNYAYYNGTDFGFALKFAAIVSVPVISIGGYFLNKHNPVLVREFSPEGMIEIPEPRHALYSIRVEYWGIIIPVITFCGILCSSYF